MYNEKVMQAFKNPKNVGEVENYDGIGTVGNASCGDIMQITIKVENNIITDAKFKTFGCAAAVATSSTATDMIIGMTIEEALTVTNKKVVETLEGLPPQKIHCSVLAEEAIKKAIEDYKSGKVKAKQALFGACMRELKNTADTAVIKELLDKKLENC